MNHFLYVIYVEILLIQIKHFITVKIVKLIYARNVYINIINLSQIIISY